MKKRNQKLSLNRETIASLPTSRLDRVAGGGVVDAVGDVTSCGRDCGCVTETGTSF